MRMVICISGFLATSMVAWSQTTSGAPRAGAQANQPAKKTKDQRPESTSAKRRPEDAASTKAAEPGSPAPSRSAVAALALRIGEVRLDDMPLRDALEQLANLAKTNIVVRWHALAEEGIEPDAPITLRLKRATVAEVLRQLLDEAGRAGDAGPGRGRRADRRDPDPILNGPVRLAYRADGEMILITTAAEFENELIVQVYEISDLAHSETRSPTAMFTRDFDYVGEVRPQVAAGAVAFQPVIRRVRSGTQITFDENAFDSRSPERDDQQARVARLVDAIMGSIEPDTWDINGGRGSIRVFGTRLIVRNSPFVHQKLGGPLVEYGLP